MRKNKKIIIVISIILILVIASAIFAYLYLMTDMLRSSQELFLKYFSQNTDTFQKITDLKKVEVYKNLKNESKYESSTNIKMVHSEGGEISNPLNNLTAKLDIQKDNEEQYTYIDGQILYDDEEYLEAEVIREQDIYGIRFTDAVKQFVTVEDDENIETIAKEIGIDTSQLETLINIINGSEQIISREQLSTLKDKYLNIIIQEAMNGMFEKQRNAMITYNNATIKTNAYSVALSNEQVENMLLEISNNIKTEKELLDKLQVIIDTDEFIKKVDEISEELEKTTIKVTVYEQKQKTIRTVIDIGLYKISIDFIEENGELKTKIDYLDLSDEQTKKYNFEITKKNIDNQENFEMTINGVEGEEDYTITILSQMKLLDSEIVINTEISHRQGITTKSLILENQVNIGNDFEKNESLISGNYILLNAIQEERRGELIGLLKKIVPQKITERTELLKEKLELKEEEDENLQTENSMSQVEINKFNAKFEFYTGDEVSAENVKMLLETVKNNLGKYSIMDTENVEDTENMETEEQKIYMMLYIEKDKTDKEGITKIQEKIDNNKKYKVLINYKETNGLIDYITITEI